MEGNTPQGEMGGASNQGGQGQPDMNAGGSDMKSQAKGLVGQLEALLDEYMVKKAPFAIPQGGREFIVTVSPYLVIVMAILAVPALLAALGMSTVLAPVAMMGGSTWGASVILSLVFSAAAVVVEVMAVPGLFKRTRAGWRLVFYATIISAVGSLVTFNIIGGIIGAIIGWYILFQVKSLYVN